MHKAAENRREIERQHKEALVSSYQPTLDVTVGAMIHFLHFRVAL